MKSTDTTMAEKKQVYGVLAEYKRPAELLEGIKTVRERGYTRIEAYTPFPIHGIDDALGSKPSKLGYLVMFVGCLGLASAILLQWWTGAVSYPLVIAGKPLFAFEFGMPIMFELTVLFSSFAAVFGMLGFNGLPQFYHPLFNSERFQKGVNDDSFVLVIESNDPKFNPKQDFSWMGGHVEVVEE